jgi:hypothetical protein
MIVNVIKPLKVRLKNIFKIAKNAKITKITKFAVLFLQKYPAKFGGEIFLPRTTRCTADLAISHNKMAAPMTYNVLIAFYVKNFLCDY